MKNRYWELGKEAKDVLSKIVKVTDLKKKQKKEQSIRWSEIEKKKEMHDLESLKSKTVKAGLSTLLNFKLVLKSGKGRETRYKLNEKYNQAIALIARKQSDKINIGTYEPSEIIDLGTINSKTTIYGLQREIFRKLTDENINLDIAKKETFEFSKGIKASEIMGKFYATPLNIKIRSPKDISEEEIVNLQVEYYKEGLKKGAKIEDVIKQIITKHRNDRIKFAEIGSNIAHKLLEFKKMHRFSELEKIYNTLLKEVRTKTLKTILKKYQKEFLNILNHCDIDKDWLEKAIWEFKGIGCGAFSNWNKDSVEFAKVLGKLQLTERENLIKFLLEVLEKNKYLYPTNVSFLTRIHSSDYLEEPLI